MSSFNFRMGGCAWCHPGGGAMEYDRDGYRYDAVGGANPNAAIAPVVPGTDPPQLADVPIRFDGMDSGYSNPGGVRYGDYWVMGATGLESKAGATIKGVAEVDCLMCHLETTYDDAGTVKKIGYNNQDRNYCMTTPGIGANMAPKLGATMGLTRTGVVSTNYTDGITDCSITYNSVGGLAAGRIPVEMIATTPRKEACALCHFPDASKPNGTGPAAAAIDWTTFQKPIAAESFTDSDTGAPNATAYNLTKGRAEAGKRAESINDAGNPDGHMDKLACADCHYNVSGSFPAVIDTKGTCSNDPTKACTVNADCGTDATCNLFVIQEGITVKSIDHQFAKGNNRPDGKNMDQMDNTVTCEGCHLNPDQNDNPRIVDNGDGTFSLNSAFSGTIALPVPKHVAIPPLHMDKIDCRTCHIPEENFVSKQMVTDFSTTPYPMDVGFERGQNLAKKVEGVPQRLHYRPLYAWQDRGHHGGELQLAPLSLGGVFVWKDLVSGVPYAKRFPTDAVKAFRASQGGTGTPGAPYTWTLNSPQGGDEALIVNKTSEISGMVNAILNLNDDSMTEPALNIYVNQFTLSHNVAPKAKALGGPENGCSACHSADSVIFASAPLETDVNSPCYGQPQGCKGLVFKQPQDGGIGLEMTCDGGDCSGQYSKRISNAIPFTCPDGSKVTVDLTAGVAHGSAVSNVIPQEEVLCYSATSLANLKQPKSSTYFANLDSVFTWKTSSTTSLKVDLDGSASKCPPSASDCSYKWDCGETGVVAADGVTSSCQYLTAGNHNVTLTVADLDAGYSDASTQTVNAKEVNGTVAPNVASDYDATTHVLQVTISGTINRATVYWGDGSSNATYSATTLSHTYTGTAAKTYSCKVYVYDKNNVRTIYTIPVAYTP